MKLGLIGAGKHGSRYARHIIQDINDACLTAICRRSKHGAQQAQEWQCRWHRDWQDLINDPEVEAVISVVPPTLNAAIAKACLAAKKPLLLEKPLATTLEDGQTIVASFREQNIPLTIAQTLRYNPVIQGLRQHLEEIGPLLSIVALHHLEPATLAWLNDRAIAGGGVALHTAIHVFDALHFITGQSVQRVFAINRKVTNPEVEDLISVHLGFSSGLSALVHAGKVSPARLGSYQLIGEQGILSGDGIYQHLELIRGTERTPLPLRKETWTLKELLGDWLSFLRGKAANPIPGEEGLAALKVSLAVLESCRSHSWVSIS